MASQTASTNQPPPAVITVPVGQVALTALGQAVKRAQSGDQFALVVVVADHLDAASSVRHWLGALGVVNVTVQTGDASPPTWPNRDCVRKGPRRMRRSCR